MEVLFRGGVHGEPTSQVGFGWTMTSFDVELWVSAFEAITRPQDPSP